MSNSKTAGDAIHQGHDARESQAVEAGASRDIWTIPQNILLKGIARYPADAQDNLLWLNGYVRSDLHGSRREACNLLGADYSTVFRILTGTYTARIDRFLQSVRHLRTTSSLPGTGFVETCQTRRIFAALDMAKTQNIIAHVVGPSGRSKSHAGREWARRNTGRAIYVDCPVIGGVGTLLLELARATNINLGRKTADMAVRVEKALDWRMTVIVDEASRLLPAGRGRDVRALEFLRRIHDRSGCGLVFVSTPTLQQEIREGRLTTYLQQLDGRIAATVVLPDKVGHDEASEICRAFNPDAPEDLIDMALGVANSRGRLRQLFRLLRNASVLAKAKTEPLCAYHLRVALASLDLDSDRNQTRPADPAPPAQNAVPPYTAN